LRAAAKMASVVTLIIEKTMKKILKKKTISDLPTLIFSRYETGTTGFFFTPYSNFYTSNNNTGLKFVISICFAIFSRHCVQRMP
jgi:hypothetical protein